MSVWNLGLNILGLEFVDIEQCRGALGQGARRRLPAGLNLIFADATPTMSACVVMPEVWC